jgi:hypothetical protein
MQSSGMLLGVAIVITDVSEESTASISRRTRFSEVGTMFSVTSNRRIVGINMYKSHTA